MLSKSELAALPVFPLPGLVFFPGSLLPLHIFEARYRAMTRFCIDFEHPMAVGMIRDGEEHLPQPGVVELMGAGRIARAQELPDGRFNVVLAGLTRVRLIEEFPLRDGYRVFRSEAVEDLDERPATVQQALRTIRACTGGLASTMPGAARALGDILERGLPPSQAADALASVAFGEPLARQEMLEELDVGERLERVAARLVELM